MLLAAAPANALPGDPPIAALSPKDGEAVPANDAGITVSFTCPPYTTREANELFGPEAGLLSDYEARFARSAAVGADGRLAEGVATGRVDARPGQPGVCVATLGQAGFPRPQSTPGTYYWQAARDCPSCAGGFEVGPVVRFVIRAAGAATLKAPDTAYAGFPFVVHATYAGTSGQVQLQRKSGSSWKTIARFIGDAEPIITLAKRGRQTLRTVVQVGSDTVTSKTQTVDVKRARNWSTSSRDDGTYRDPRAHLGEARGHRQRQADHGLSGRRPDALRQPELDDRYEPQHRPRHAAGDQDRPRRALRIHRPDQRPDRPLRRPLEGAQAARDAGKHRPDELQRLDRRRRTAHGPINGLVLASRLHVAGYRPEQS